MREQWILEKRLLSGVECVVVMKMLCLVVAALM